jgi:ferric-dicitrate binding protein FerR (iron transport regulator)
MEGMKPLRFSAVYAAIFVAASAQAGPETSDRLRISEVKGPQDVAVVRAVGRRKESVQAGDDLQVGDEVDTVKGQVVTLDAYDGSKWKVGSEAQFRVESRKPEKQNYFYWTFSLIRGAMWGKVEKASEGESGFRLKTRTKTAAMGVRGTEYLVGSDADHSEIDVLEGKVWWGPSIGFEDGSYKEIPAGEHAELWANGKMETRKSDGDAGALQRHYGLLPSLAGEHPLGVKKTGSPDDCRAFGKGWCSHDGARPGECCD